MNVCRDVQIKAQQAVIDDGPYKNKGKIVKTAAKVVDFYKDSGLITDECASCIMNQFARGIPIEEQQPCYDQQASGSVSLKSAQDRGTNPRINNLSPKKGTYGDSLTVEGNEFLNEQGQVVFRRSGIEKQADVTEWTDTKIVASVPSGIKKGSNKVKVVTIDGNKSNSKSFILKTRKPVISGLSGKSVKAGSQIRITGRNFGEFNDRSQVMFDNINGNIIEWTNKSITVTVPAIEKGKAVSVKVKTSYGTSNSKKINVLKSE